MLSSSQGLVTFRYIKKTTTTIWFVLANDRTFGSHNMIFRAKSLNLYMFYQI